MNSKNQDRLNGDTEAIAEGIVEGPVGEIVAPIGRKSTSIIEREVREDGGMPVPLFKVLAHTESHTFLDLELQTGRTHQIEGPYGSRRLPAGWWWFIWRERERYTSPSPCIVLSWNFYILSQRRWCCFKKSCQKICPVCSMEVKDGIPDFITGHIKTNDSGF